MLEEFLTCYRLMSFIHISAEIDFSLETHIDTHLN